MVTDQWEVANENPLRDSILNVLAQSQFPLIDLESPHQLQQYKKIGVGKKTEDCPYLEIKSKRRRICFECLLSWYTVEAD